MTHRPLAAVVLAAGEGKRMRAPVPKVLVRACGLPLVEHVLDALSPLEPERTVVVCGHGGDKVPRALAHHDLRFSTQPKQNGTGDAVRCALPELEGFAGDVLVLCGDTPLLTSEALGSLVEDHRVAGRALTLLSAELADPGSLGRVLRDGNGRLRGIREAADASEEERAIREINTGVILIAMEHLAGALARLGTDNAQGELYLTDVPGLLLEDGHPVEAHRTRDVGAALGVNNPLELAEAVRLLRERYRARHLAAGVWMDDPGTVVLDAGVEIGVRTRLGPFVHLGPRVGVGRGCLIGAHVTVGGSSVIGDDVVIDPGTVVPRETRLVTGTAYGRGAWAEEPIDA